MQHRAGHDGGPEQRAAGQLDQRALGEVRVADDVPGVVDRRRHHLELIQDLQRGGPGQARDPAADLALDRVVVRHPRHVGGEPRVVGLSSGRPIARNSRRAMTSLDAAIDSQPPSAAW